MSYSSVGEDETGKEGKLRPIRYRPSFSDADGRCRRRAKTKPNFFTRPKLLFLQYEAFYFSGVNGEFIVFQLIDFLEKYLS